MKHLTIAAALAAALIAPGAASAAVPSAGLALASTFVDEPADFVVEATYGYSHRISLYGVLRKLQYQGYHGFTKVKWLDHAYIVYGRNWYGTRVRIKVSAYSGDIYWVKRSHWRHHRHHDDD